jgi:hypothetical protein
MNLKIGAAMQRALPLAAAIASGLGILACENGMIATSEPQVRRLDPVDPFGLFELKAGAKTPDFLNAPQDAQNPRSPYSCALSWKTDRDDAGYRYARVRFRIPSEEQHPTGEMVRYYLRVEEPGQAPVAVAHCVVPNTPEALRKISRMVGHNREGNTKKRGGAKFDSLQFLPGVTVYASPTTWYSGGSGGWWDDGWDGSTYDSGGGPMPDFTPPPNCYPNKDTLCLTRLRAADTVLIMNALNVGLNALWYIPDTAVRRRCSEMKQVMDTMLAMNFEMVFRGAYNTAEPGTKGYHHGATSEGYKVHIDPWLLDSAATGNPTWVAQLASTLLHEAAHLIEGASHPEGELGYYFYQGDTNGLLYGYQYYTNYFKDVNYKGAYNINTCISYP